MNPLSENRKPQTLKYFYLFGRLIGIALWFSKVSNDSLSVPVILDWAILHVLRTGEDLEGGYPNPDKVLDLMKKVYPHMYKEKIETPL